MTEKLERVPLTRIVPSRWQPREAAFDPESLWELACSIKEHGLINPVVVFPVNVAEDDPEPWYELVAGERRTRAGLGLAWAALDDQVTEKEAVEALAAGGLTSLPDHAREALAIGGDNIEWANGWSHILARVESGETAEDLQRLHRLAIVENIERESLSALEEARGLQGLADEFDWSQRDLARHIGKSQSYVAQRLSLLGLAPEAQEAVSTRVLTATHGRAIAAVPEALQPVVTEHVAAMVSRDDSPATTRQVQNLTRQVAAFVDPARWEPNGERVYLPTQRNRLALVKWALERVDLEACAERLMGLRSVGYSGDNVLGGKPVAVVTTYLREILDALLGDGRSHDWWEEFAHEVGRTCEHCVLYEYEVDGTDPDSSMEAYCPQWRDEIGHLETCQGFIGSDHPVVIPVGKWHTTDLFEEVGAVLEEGETCRYMRSIPDYVKAYELAAELERSRRIEQEQKRETGYQDDIRAFMDWVGTLPGEIHAHFQSQVCGKCANCAPACDPPCVFTQEPLGNQWSRYGPRFAVLVDQEGQLYPRCSEFAYANTPELHQEGARFGRKVQAAEWLEAIAAGRGYNNSCVGLVGVLRWLDYGRAPEEDKFDKLASFVKREWDELGGDSAVATLIDVALHEVKATNARSTLKLLNAVTGKMETFAAATFETVREGKDPQEGYYSSWPKGWPAPWVSTDAEETEEVEGEG
jgi:ParB-like chromosome segregation protein Spo0J